MPIIEKYLKDSFILIDLLNSKKTATLHVGKTKKHALNNRPAIIEFNEKKYILRYKTLVPKGVQNHNELKVRRETELLIKCKNQNYYTEGKNVLPTNISIPGFDNPRFENRRLKKLVISNVSSLSTVKKSFYKRERYYRAIIPTPKEVRLFGNFTGWTFNVDGKRYFETLMKLNISVIYFIYHIKMKV